MFCVFLCSPSLSLPCFLCFPICLCFHQCTSSSLALSLTHTDTSRAAGGKKLRRKCVKRFEDTNIEAKRMWVYCLFKSSSCSSCMRAMSTRCYQYNLWVIYEIITNCWVEYVVLDFISLQVWSIKEKECAAFTAGGDNSVWLGQMLKSYYTV